MLDGVLLCWTISEIEPMIHETRIEERFVC